MFATEPLPPQVVERISRGDRLLAECFQFTSSWSHANRTAKEEASEAFQKESQVYREALRSGQTHDRPPLQSTKEASSTVTAKELPIYLKDYQPRLVKWRLEILLAAPDLAAQNPDFTAVNDLADATHVCSAVNFLETAYYQEALRQNSINTRQQTGHGETP